MAGNGQFHLAGGSQLSRLDLPARRHRRCYPFQRIDLCFVGRRGRCGANGFRPADRPYLLRFDQRPKSRLEPAGLQGSERQDSRPATGSDQRWRDERGGRQLCSSHARRTRPPGTDVSDSSVEEESKSSIHRSWRWFEFDALGWPRVDRRGQAAERRLRSQVPGRRRRRRSLGGWGPGQGVSRAGGAHRHQGFKSPINRQKRRPHEWDNLCYIRSRKRLCRRESLEGHASLGCGDAQICCRQSFRAAIGYSGCHIVPWSSRPQQPGRKLLVVNNFFRGQSPGSVEQASGRNVESRRGFLPPSHAL